MSKGGPLSKPTGPSPISLNTKGRVIHKGPRGGYYVLEKGKKIYKFTRAYKSPLLPKPTGPSPVSLNTKGRVIHKGSRGGYYVIKKGKKIHKFTRATASKGAPLSKSPLLPKSPKLKTPMKERLKKFLEKVRKRRTYHVIRMNKQKTLYFKKFDPLQKRVLESDREVIVKIPTTSSNQIMGITEDTLPLQSWLDAQSKYINNLNEYDYMTALAYTVRSHQWIGPWMRTKKIANVRFTKPKGFIVPLYPQVKKVLEEKKNRTKFEDDIISDYKNYVSDINKVFAADKKKALNLYIEDLKRIIKNAPPLPKTMYVYRGLDRDIFKGQIGVSHTLCYFSSTGYVPQWVYAPQHYMRIKLLKGTRVLLLQGLNNWNHEGEYEIVLNKDSKYIITKRNLLRYVQNRVVPYPVQKYVTDVTLF